MTGAARLSMIGLAVLVSVGGCHDCSKSAAKGVKPAERHARAGQASEQRRAAREARLRRERRKSREAPLPSARVTVGEGAGAEHRTVKPGQPLGEASGQPVRVELAQAGQVGLRPGAYARLGSVAPAQVILSGGRVTMDRPGGVIGQPPLRVATPAVTVVIPAMGQAEVAALPDGRAWVGVVSGQVELETGRMGRNGRLERRSLGAGQQALVATGKAPPEVSPLVPAAAAAKGSPQPSALSAKAGSRANAMMRSAAPAALEAAERMSEQAVAALDALLGEVKAEHDTGDVLAQALEHVASTDAERVRGLRRKIVAHSATLLHLHWRLLPVWERVAATGDWLSRRAGPKRPEDLGDRTSRVQAELHRQP